VPFSYSDLDDPFSTTCRAVPATDKAKPRPRFEPTTSLSDWLDEVSRGCRPRFADGVYDRREA